MNQHSTLSPSRAPRWTLCPASGLAENNMVTKPNPSALEGKIAHSIAAHCLHHKIDPIDLIDTDIEGNKLSYDMAHYIKKYYDFVLEYQHDNDILKIEYMVNYDNIIPQGFGTLDACIITSDTIHVFDLKYGYTPVDANKNMQCILYAIGIFNEVKHHIKQFVMHIVQPRIFNYSTWEINEEELHYYSEFIKRQALIASMPDAPAVPGAKQCQYCSVRHKCKALRSHVDGLIHVFDVNVKQNMILEKMLDTDIKRVLENKKVIQAFLDSIEENLIDRIQAGEKLEGYKLVEGRSFRKWNQEAEQYLVEKFGQKAYQLKLISITEARKIMNDDEIAIISSKKRGKPVLAKDTDKRPDISNASLINLL